MQIHANSGPLETFALGCGKLGSSGMVLSVWLKSGRNGNVLNGADGVPFEFFQRLIDGCAVVDLYRSIVPLSDLHA
jgi:hypothetical protein